MKNKCLTTKVGMIGFEDHRLRGFSVLNELMGQKDLLDLHWISVLGTPLTDEKRETLALLTCAATATDAHVWPVKLARLVSSYGNPIMGMYVAQFISMTDRIGAGSMKKCMESLIFIQNELNKLQQSSDPKYVEPILMNYLEKHKILNGFGVPFRASDERLDALMLAIRGKEAENGVYFKLSQAIVQIMRERKKIPPNLALATSAIVLDLGVPPQAAVLICTLLILAPSFSGQAFEASQEEFHFWQKIDSTQIEYQGPSARDRIK